MRCARSFVKIYCKLSFEFREKTVNLSVKAINHEVPPASIARNVVHKRAKESCALFELYYDFGTDHR